ncbi:Lar family restriction alleviation protein [Pseudomonas aeruginosa]|uniref:Lar family restriction alleviation protein n=1 Tax=Pseudomonas aeruginosa TaxID=287 RepID=UPI001404B022
MQKCKGKVPFLACRKLALACRIPLAYWTYKAVQKSGEAVSTGLKLLACPFCGCERIGIHLKRAARKEGFQAMCLGCKVGQTQTMYSTPERAAEAWNTRAPAAA